MDKIGKYQIVGELGTGGFGTVYKATDPTMGRLVAIKILKAQDDAGMIKRFQAEARTAANLRHRNIVTVFEFGEEHGVQFLVMEYLEGATLRDLIEQKAPLSTLEKLTIMSESALGLKAAHESGILHRDVKPANIMRLTDGSVKIMDFGISRPMGDADTRLTQAGIIMGTPQYMAPEQFTSSEDADVLCDIWAYGVVLYEFLTGFNPFYAATAGQIIYRVTSEEPPPISQVLRELPERFDATVKRLLSKARERRFQSIEDARDEMQPVLLELRQKQIEGLIASAGDLIRDRHLDEAQVLVRRVLDLDPANSWARKWRNELREMLRVINAQSRVKQLLEKASSEMAAGDEPSAAEHLKEALKVDPANAEIRRMLDEIQANRARAERAASLLANAREDLNRKALTRALDHANQAATTDPKSDEAKKLVSEIQEIMERRDIEAARRNSLNSATRLVLLQAYDEAIQTLQQFLAQSPGDPTVETRLEEVQRLYAAHQEQQRIERAIAESKDLLRRGNYRSAIDILQPCREGSPDNSEVAQLLAYAREQEEIEARAAQVRGILDQADAAAESGDFDAALDLTAKALDVAPDNDRAQQLRDRMLEARRRREEDREITRQAARCRAGLEAGKLDEASVIASELVNRFPGHPEAVALRKQVDAAIRERREAHERELREQAQRVEQLLSAGRSDEATVILQSLTARFPGQKQAFAPLFDRAAQVDRDNRERSEAAQRAQEVTVLLNAGRADEATMILESLAARFPGQRQTFAPLMDRAAEIERNNRDRQQIEADLARFRQITASGKWEEALAEIEAGLARRPNQPQFVEERDNVLRRLAGAQAVRDIEGHLTRGEIEQAIALAGTAQRLYPDEPRIATLLATAKAERDLAGEVRRAEALLRRNEIAKADELIAALLNRAQSDEGVARLVRAREQRRQDAAHAVHEIEEALGRAEVESALALAEDAERRFPEEPRIGGLLATARAQRDLAGEIRRAEGLVRRNEIAQADPLIAELLRRAPGDEAVQRLKAERDQRREQASQSVRDIEQTLAKGDVEKALTLAETAERQFPEEPRIAGLLAAARAQRSLTLDIRRAETLLRRNEVAQADNLIGELMRRSPADDGVKQLQRKREERRTHAAQTVREVERLLAKGELDQALTLAENSEQQYPEVPRIGELLAATRAQRSLAGEIRRAETLLRRGEIPQADSLIAELLRRAPGDEAVQALQRERQQRRERAAQVVREIEQTLAKGDVEKGLALAGEAEQQYPEESRIGDLLAAARAQRSLADEVRRAEDLLCRNEIAEADSVLAALLRRAPADERVKRVQQQREQRRASANRAIGEIEQALARGEADRAIGLAETAERQFPEEQRTGPMLAAAREQRAVLDQVRRAEERIAKGEADQAGAMIADLVRRYPNDANVQRARQSLDRVAKRRQSFAAAEQCRKRLEFNKALEIARQLVHDDADDPAARDLLETITREQAAYETSQRVNAARAEAGRLLGSRKFDAARDALNRLAREFPDNRDIQDDLRRVQEARQEHERKEAYARSRAEADALVKQRRLDDAIAKLQSLLQTYPDDPLLLQDLNAAEETKKLRDRAATVEAEIRALEALFNKGDAQGVKDRASRLLEKYEEPRARELLNWATRTLEDVRGIRRRADGGSRRWMIIGGIAALLLLAVVIYLKTRPEPQVQTQTPVPLPTPAASIAVTPAELTFGYQRGGKEPASKTIKVDGKPATEVWAVTATDPWFTVSPSEITGAGTVAVGIAPAALSPGEYSGFITVAPKDGTAKPASVRVRLSVIAEPAKTEPPPKVEKKLPPVETKKTEPPPPEKTEPKPVVTTPPPPVQQQLPTEPPVDCHAPDYNDLLAGRIRWTGSLAPGETVTIGRRNRATAGKASGSALPGCDVGLRILNGNVQFAEPPSAANKFGHVVVKNPGAAPISNFEFQWTVK